ncbi:hypothetical protein C7C46_23260 [Streptomyces tateyamensis]|uniref:Uncharacterized protein n=1 Tax=Streptomyces tateyamensis TaxID=565073 RepID=A0A2V4NBB2_9ACTN|nr:hypothetical protein [Streptomyces tateyamensis]PYC75805.1 hypothetical protein C7C46_23260 [Streptomyces tateyamensis]
MAPLLLAPPADDRRTRFRRYARSHFPAPPSAQPAVLVSPARRRAVGRPADLVRLARLARLG